MSKVHPIQGVKSANFSSRRQFLQRAAGYVSALAVPSVFHGCQAVQAKGATEQAAMVRWLSEKYGIVDSKIISDQTVIILADAHVPLVVRKNAARLQEIEKAFNIEILGVENFISGPNSSDEMAMWKNLAGIFDTDILNGGNLNSLGYSQFFDRPEFKTLGLEEQNCYTTTQVLGVMVTLYDLLVLGASNPRAFQGKNYPKMFPFHGGFLESIRKGELALEKLNIMAPKIEVAKFPHLTEKGDIDVCKIETAGLEHLEKNLEDLKFIAFHDQAVPRNQRAAEKMANAMREGNVKHAAIIIGAAHLDPNLISPTLQSLLMQQGLSYVVLKLPSGLPNVMRDGISPEFLSK